MRGVKPQGVNDLDSRYTEISSVVVVLRHLTLGKSSNNKAKPDVYV